MLLVAALWGGSYAIVKDAYREIDPMPFLLVRFTLASLALAPVIWRLRPRWPVGRTQWLGTILVGLAGIGAYQLLFSIGLLYTTASNSTLIISTSPVFTALLAPLAGLGRPNRLQLASIPISMLGIYLLTGAEGGLSGPYLKGNLLSLAAAFSVALSFTLSEKLLGNAMGVAVMSWAVVAGTVSLLPWTLPATLAFDWSGVSLTAWLELAYAAFLAGALGYVLWYHNLARLGAVRGSVYAFTIPVVGVVTAVLLLGEPLQWRQAGGGLLVLLGVAVARARIPRGRGGGSNGGKREAVSAG